MRSLDKTQLKGHPIAACPGLVRYLRQRNAGFVAIEGSKQADALKWLAAQKQVIQYTCADQNRNAPKGGRFIKFMPGFDVVEAIAARCAIHGNPMICPSCIGKRGGQETARTHPGRHPEWGRKGALARGRK